ncbi:MAG: alpha-glucan family phosphorylase [Vulcanimicrobiaceae bacterium]
MRDLNSALFETESGVRDPLVELALDLRNCWDHTTDPVWRKIDPELWELTHNPWVVLQTASGMKLKALEDDPVFGARVRELRKQQREDVEARAWFQRVHGGSSLSCVAYCSMEFGLSEALPIYSGGLGNVAGDQLKGASDLGVPVVGVGLLYQQGHFRQVIDGDGSQRALYPYNDPGQLPITPVRNKEGEWFRLNVILPGQKVWLRAWQAQIGRLKLYLLDSNDPANPPAYRGITSELYGGGPELRLMQEVALGIGGWRLLRGLGLSPEVCHLNEGHAAFAVLERARSFMEDTGQSFEAALAVTRAGNVFTTHTPVEAGFDRFAPSLIGPYLERYARERLGIDLRRLLALGRADAGNADEPFNLAHLAIRGSGTIDGVSRLHGAVSRNIFQGLFPRWPEAEVPVAYVTNGVHAPTWDSEAADALWTAACGADRWRGALEAVGDDIRKATDGALWELRASNRLELVRFVRERVAFELAARGGDSSVAAGRFDPNTLTLGFARRFATCKRPNLLLHDPERLVRMLTDPARPVQLVLAGKAHPQDRAGQAMVKAWIEFVERPEVRRHAVFLSDYDLVLAERLVQGADLWINTPRRPWEACGTSGMKVLVNGGLNLSELDGWWAEAYSPAVGWALGDGNEHGDDPAWDAAEAEELYDVLEKQVIPAFYNRAESGIPTEWVALMRESMSLLTPQFSAGTLLQWKQALAEHWASLRFGELRVTSTPQEHAVRTEVYLGELRADWVRIQMYADPRKGEPPFTADMTQREDVEFSPGARIYLAEVPASRPASDYTPRIIPSYSGASVPLEEAHILWYGA